MSKYIKVGNFKIINGNIQNSIIDMNSQKITTVGDPTELHDVVNLKTLNAVVSGTPPTNIYQTDISLVGITPVPIPFLGNVGQYNMKIISNNNPTNAPIMNSILIKNRATSNGYIHSFGSEIGVSSTEIIFATWTSNNNIIIQKQGGNIYDGSYHVTVVIQ
jgi:hypothetical protein